MGQSAEFGKFLPVMGARMRPETAGVPTTKAARRVPGLRRAKIAQRAGVSTDYYTRLEQGRQIRPSASVVNAVARALQLDAGERAHMVDQLHNRPPSSKSPDRVQRVPLADELGHQPAQLGLAWLLAQPAVTAPIIGPRTPEQLDAAVHALDVRLEEKTLTRLDQIFPGHQAAPEDSAW